MGYRGGFETMQRDAVAAHTREIAAGGRFHIALASHASHAVHYRAQQPSATMAAIAWSTRARAPSRETWRPSPPATGCPPLLARRRRGLALPVTLSAPHSIAAERLGGTDAGADAAASRRACRSHARADRRDDAARSVGG